MLSKAQNKYIRSLSLQKFRDENNVFIAEGAKIAHEWLSSGSVVDMIVATEEWAGANAAAIRQRPDARLHIVSIDELASLSTLKTPNQVLLVVPKPPPKEVPVADEWYLALDGVQDPGNMGTIIRIADWFGIKHVVCSPGCADVYSPKVVQSAMGAHLRVDLYEAPLVPFLQSLSIPTIAAMLDGENIYKVHRIDAGVLIIGNESKGISAEVAALATKKVLIPGRGGAESLNAAVSAGIICALLLPC